MSPVSADDGLERCEPENKGVRSESILAFLKDADTSGVNLNSFMLYCKGSVISEGWWYPYGPELRHMMHSGTKSFLSAAVGMAIHEGYFTLQDKVASFFPEYAPSEPDPKAAAMTVEDLLTQTAGHSESASGTKWRSIKTSWVEQFFKIPVIDQPGTVFKYSSATSFLLAAIVQHTTGQNVHQFLMPRLFQPLGITDTTWDFSPDGISTGGSGLNCRSSDLLKLAILHLQGGVWNGRRLLTEEWVASATKAQRGNKYGYHWWAGEGNIFYAFGLFGQFAFVFPDDDAILVTTASIPVGKANLREIVWRHFSTMFKSDKDLTIPADMELENYLKGLRILQPLQPATSEKATHISDRLFVAESNADTVEGFSFDFNDNECVFHMWDQRGLHRVEVGLKDWIKGETTVSEAKLHHGYEPPMLPVVAGGRWVSPTQFEMTWRFVETSFEDRLILQIFDNDTATLDRSVNVNLFATKRPTIYAHMLGESSGLSAGLRITERATVFLNSGYNHITPALVYSTSMTPFGDLLDDAEANAILLREIPDLLSIPRIQLARPYPLVRIAAFVPQITEDILKRIGTEIGKIPRS